MDWDEIQQQWPQYQGLVQQHWSRLTESDLDRIAGRRDRLVSRIQEVYGTTAEDAQRAVEEFAAALRPSEESEGARKHALLFNERIRGVKVIAADGRSIGEVGDLLVDSGTWLVKSVQIKLDKEIADELGVQRGRFHAAIVHLPVRMIQSVGDHVLLTVSAEGLRPTLRAYKDAA